MAKLDSRLWAACVVAGVMGLALGLEDADCQHGGICEGIRTGFVDIVEGQECRGVFVDGSCNSLCLSSLDALLSTSKWGKCADMCGWSHVFTEGARAWLEMCKSRPPVDPGANKVESRRSASTRTAGRKGADAAPSPEGGAGEAATPRERRIAATAVALFVLGLGAFVAARILSANGYTTSSILRWFQRRGIALGSRSRKRSKGGILDPGPESFADRRPFRPPPPRGVRRHLAGGLHTWND